LQALGLSAEQRAAYVEFELDDEHHAACAGAPIMMELSGAVRSWIGAVFDFRFVENVIVKNKWSRRERLYQIVKYDQNTGQEYSEWLLAPSQPALRREHELSDAQVVIPQKWATVEVNYDDDIFFVVKADDGKEWRVDRAGANYEHFCRILAKSVKEILDAIQKDNEERYGGY